MDDRPAIDPATGWDLDRRLGRGVPTMRAVSTGAVLLGVPLFFGPPSWKWLMPGLFAVVSAASVLVLGLQARALARARFEGAEGSRQLRRELAWLYLPIGAMFVYGCLVLALLPADRSRMGDAQRLMLGTVGAASGVAFAIGAFLTLKHRHARRDGRGGDEQRGV